MNVKSWLAEDDTREFTVRITAPVSDFKALLKQLESIRSHGWHAWPLCGLVSCIEKVIADLDKVHLAHARDDAPKPERDTAMGTPRSVKKSHRTDPGPGDGRGYYEEDAPGYDEAS